MKYCLKISVYQNQHCFDSKKTCFARVLYYEEDVPNNYSLFLQVFRVLYGSAAVVTFEVTPV